MRRAAVFILSLFLVLVYLVLDQNYIHWQTTPPAAYQQQQEVLREIYRYAANNIFDKGYQREIESELHRRLSIYPSLELLERGQLLMPDNSAEKVLKLDLPSGFRGGILSLKVTTDSNYVIGVSPDLNSWQLTEFPGNGQKVVANLNLVSADFLTGVAYLKLLPAANKSLSVYFDIFQYLAGEQTDPSQYQGYFLFLPDTDIDYQGKAIIQPGVIYEK